MFSAMSNAPTSPMRWRSSGTWAMPRRWRWRAEARVMSSPSSATLPPTTRRSPVRASVSSVWPLPCTPAMPTTSPARTVTSMPSTATSSRSDSTRNCRASSTVAFGCAGFLSTVKRTARPTISSARSASLAVPLRRSPTILPRRRTLMRSATSSTSPSLWVMKMRALPASRSERTMPKNSSTSCGVSTAVGSSKISTLAERNSTLMISTRCWTPTGSSSISASGSTSRPYCSDIARTSRARSCAVQPAEAPRLELDAQHDVLGDGEHRHQHEVLMDHADAGGGWRHRGRERARAFRRAGSGPRRGGKGR